MTKQFLVKLDASLVEESLISLLSNENAQMLVGGHDGGSGASGVECPGRDADQVDAPTAAAFVNNLHGLGCNHVNDGLTKGAAADPTQLHGTTTLKNGKTLSPAG